MQPVNPLLTGKRYETQALSYLEQQGLTYIASNIRYPVGELDLIMLDQHVLVFIEVRFRRSDKYGGALLSVTPKKQQRLIKAALYWMSENNYPKDHTDYRFDVFAITKNKVEWITNAFNEETIYY